MEKHDEKAIVRLDLTPRQKEQVKLETGKDADAIVLTIRELEQRIAPRVIYNHNETLLIDSSD